MNFVTVAALIVFSANLSQRKRKEKNKLFMWFFFVSINNCLLSFLSRHIFDQREKYIENENALFKLNLYVT
jgi:hypothetical protein